MRKLEVAIKALERISQFTVNQFEGPFQFIGAGAKEIAENALKAIQDSSPPPAHASSQGGRESYVGTAGEAAAGEGATGDALHPAGSSPPSVASKDNHRVIERRPCADSACPFIGDHLSTETTQTVMEKPEDPRRKQCAACFTFWIGEPSTCPECGVDQVGYWKQKYLDARRTGYEEGKTAPAAEQGDFEKFVPGLFECPKCDFVLVSNTLYMKSGTIGANNKPQECSNGCGPMWRVSWRKHAETLSKRLEKLCSRNEGPKTKTDTTRTGPTSGGDVARPDSELIELLSQVEAKLCAHPEAKEHFEKHRYKFECRDCGDFVYGMEHATLKERFVAALKARSLW